MIAPAKPLSRYDHTAANAQFEQMLPHIHAMALQAFGHHDRERRCELAAEVVARAYAAFLRLAEQGRADIGYATPLALFSIKQVRSGRRLGTKLNVRDVSSEYAQLNKGISMRRLDRFDAEEGRWQELLVEDRRSGPAEIASTRIDFAAWLQSLPSRERRIAATLSMGESTGATAKKFGVSPSRISQLRTRLKHAWETFIGEPPAKPCPAAM